MRQHDKVRTLRAINANPGIRAAYRRALRSMVRAMREDYERRLSELYAVLETRIVGDAKWRSPLERLQEALDKLSDKWGRKFSSFAEKTAPSFVKGVFGRVVKSRKQAVEEAGFAGAPLKSLSLKEQAMDRRVQALIAENVALIKTIPQDCHARIQSMVTRAVAGGQSEASLARDIAKAFGVTERRAGVIARDQTLKATQSIAQTADKEMGITEGVWIHVPGRKSSRPTHVAMNGKKFTLTTGLWDSEVSKWVKPGELILCFPGDAEFNVFCGIEKLYRRRYAGKLTVLVADDGTVLSATPNHPVLTLEGWKPAQALNLGDHIVQMGGESLFVGGFNGKNPVAKLGQLDEALGFLGVPASVLHGSSGDFHGDGSDGDVDVVDVRGFLADMIDAEGRKTLRELVFADVFVDADASSFAFDGLSLGERLRALGSSAGSVGRLCDALAVLRSHMGEAVEFCFLHAAALYAVGDEPAFDNAATDAKTLCNGDLGHSGSVEPDNLGIVSHDALAMARNLDACSLEMLAHSIRVPSDNSGYQLDGISSPYKFSTLVKRFDREFSGHVYNLQTSLGWYTISNCIVKNCACKYRAVVPESWVAKKSYGQTVYE